MSKRDVFIGGSWFAPPGLIFLLLFVGVGACGDRRPPGYHQCQGASCNDGSGDGVGDDDGLGDTAGDSDETITDTPVDLGGDGTDIRPTQGVVEDDGTFTLADDVLKEETISDQNLDGGTFEHTEASGDIIQMTIQLTGRFTFNVAADYTQENDLDGTELSGGTFHLLPGYAPVEKVSVLGASDPTIDGVGQIASDASILRPPFEGDFDVSFTIPAWPAGDFYGQFGVAMVQLAFDRWASETLVSINYKPESPSAPYLEKHHGGYDSTNSNRNAHTFRIWRTGSTITASIDGTWVSNPFDFGAPIMIGIFFIPSSSGEVFTMPLNGWSGATINPCIPDGCWTASADGGQILTAPWVDMGFSELHINEPTSSEFRFLMSFDGRNTWKTYDGSAWVDSSFTNIMSEGMTTADYQLAPFLDPQAFVPGITPSLDIAVGHTATDSAADAWLDYVEFDFEAAGRFVSAVMDVGPNPIYGQVSYTSPQNLEAINVRAGPTESPDDSWTPWLTVVAGDMLTPLDGNRYLQYEIVFRSTQENTRPSVRNLTFEVTNRGYSSNPATVVAPPVDISGKRVVSVRAETSEPENTSIRWAVSKDGATWHGYFGESWQSLGADSGLVDSLPAAGMTTAAVQGITQAQWLSFLDGATTLYLAFSLASTNASQTPSVSGLTVTTAE